MDMLKQLIGASLFHLPLSVPLWGICFCMTRWGQRRVGQKIRILMRFVLLLSTSVLLLGLVYGILRFSGRIVYADEAVFLSLFDAGWQEEGFHYVYWCAVALLGILSADLTRMKGEQHGKGKSYCL